MKVKEVRALILEGTDISYFPIITIGGVTETEAERDEKEVISIKPYTYGNSEMDAMDVECGIEIAYIK